MLVSPKIYRTQEQTSVYAATYGVFHESDMNTERSLLKGGYKKKPSYQIPLICLF